jgi:hypothetical protein
MNSHLGVGGMAWVAILSPPHTQGNSSFCLILLNYMTFAPFFLMLIAPLDAAHLFYPNAAILGWLLYAVLP